MIELFIILILILPIIYCLIVVFRIIQFYRREIFISRALIFSEFIVTAIFLLYHYYLLPEKRVFIYSELISNPTDYGDGIANLAIWGMNYLISLGFYLFTQILFWIFIKREIRKTK
jgi:hypothetical protein